MTVKIPAACLQCGETFSADPGDGMPACPSCASLDVQLLSGRGAESGEEIPEDEMFFLGSMGFFDDFF